MTKGFSLGDFSVNEQAGKGSSGKGFNLNDFNDKVPVNQDVVKENPSIKNFIPIQRNEDGSVKYTFDNIYDNEQLASVAKDYYTKRDGVDYDDKEAVKKFISDRTWNQANTFAMGKEFVYVTGNNFGEDQKARLSYLTRYWSELPNFYEEGGLGMGQFFKNIGIGILDPINVLGAGVGGIVSKGVLKKAGQAVIKEQIKKGVTKKTVAKEVLNDPTQLAELSKQANRSALLKGSGSMAAVDAAGFGTIDIANQVVEKDIGLRETLDPVRTGTVALTAGGLGFFVAGAGGYLGNKLVNLKLEKNATLQSKKLKEFNKKTPDNKNKSEANNSQFGAPKLTSIRTNLADQWDFVKALQKEVTGVGGDVASLKKLYKSGDFKTDPILEPYFQLRTLAASGTRAHNFIMEGVYQPPKVTARSASYTKGESKGLHEILKPFDQANEVNEFLGYVASKRMKVIARRRPNLDKTLPIDKATRQEFIDFGELSASAYKKKYGQNLTRKNNFSKAINDYKKFTDELLEYQVQSGLIARKDATKILKENPFFIPLTRDRTATTRGIISKTGEQTRKLLGLARPGAVKLAKAKQEGDINLYQNLVTYTYQTVLAGDRNRAKIAFYNMVKKGERLGKYDKNTIVKLVTGKDRAKIENIPVERIKKAYTNAGAKFDPAKEIPTRIGKPRKESLDNLDSLDVLTFSNTFRKSDEASADFADIVYRNGKAEVYEIIDPNLAEAFKGLGDAGTDRIFSMFGNKGLFNRYARFASQAITYSPPFVAFNVIRDTLAGTVNSAFGIVSGGKLGFVPGFSSGKGYIDAVRHTQQYKEALLNGMGYSSRSESKEFAPRNVKSLVEEGASLGILKETTNYYTSNLKRLFFKPLGYGARQYKKLVQSAEYATRMGEFQLAKAAGFSDIGAAFAGREVATDFGMRGSSVLLNAINRNTMFFNASIQGLYRTGRVFFEQPKRAAALVAATIVAPEIALYHLNSRHKEYAQVPDQVKQLNYLIPNYTTDELGNRILDPELPFYAIPKPYDLGVFANVATSLLDGMYKKSSGVTAKYAAESFSLISPGLPIPSGIRPFIELMFNKNLYSGAPVIGIYEMQKLSELQARPSTRKIAQKMANGASNFANFITMADKDTLKPSMSPIVMDYLVGAYFTGLAQYPFDIANAQITDPKSITQRVGKKLGLVEDTDKIQYNIPPTKREDEADLSSFKNALSIVTRRFKVAAPIKRSKYHEEWSKLVQRAKKLKQVDFTQMDLKKRNESFLIGLGIRITDKIAEGFRTGLEPEVLQFSKISPILTKVEQTLLESRRERNTIMALDLSPENKREQIDLLMSAENELLQSVVNSLATIEDLDTIFTETWTDKMGDLGVIKGSLFQLLFLGDTKDTVKPNPRIQN